MYGLETGRLLLWRSRRVHLRSQNWEHEDYRYDIRLRVTVRLDRMENRYVRATAHVESLGSKVGKGLQCRTRRCSLDGLHPTRGRWSSSQRCCTEDENYAHYYNQTANTMQDLELKLIQADSTLTVSRHLFSRWAGISSLAAMGEAFVCVRPLGRCGRFRGQNCFRPIGFIFFPMRLLSQTDIFLIYLRGTTRRRKS